MAEGAGKVPPKPPQKPKQAAPKKPTKKVDINSPQPMREAAFMKQAGSTASHIFKDVAQGKPFSIKIALSDGKASCEFVDAPFTSSADLKKFEARVEGLAKKWGISNYQNQINVSAPATKQTFYYH